MYVKYLYLYDGSPKLVIYKITFTKHVKSESKDLQIAIEIREALNKRGIDLESSKGMFEINIVEPGVSESNDVR